MQIFNIDNKTLAAAGPIIICDSFLPNKNHALRVCNFCQKHIDQHQVATALQVEGDSVFYHYCNACKSSGLSINAAIETISTVNSAFKKALDDARAVQNNI